MPDPHQPTDASGATVVAYQLDEYGIRVETSGSSGQPFRYTGEQWDQEANVLYLRSRYYRPDLGRFMGRDSLLRSGPGIVGLNRYTYVGNNPTSLVDPDGLQGIDFDELRNCLQANGLMCLFPRFSPDPGGTLFASADPLKDLGQGNGGDDAARGAGSAIVPQVNRVTLRWR